jgi:peptidoglycan/LPS O-acetylase OafA/YrhL
LSKLFLVQVLRGLAALAVAVLHARHDATARAGGAGPLLDRLGDLPWAAGVDVFFVISGFIMVHAARPLFGAQGARRTFLARRVARIVPLYWAVTSLYLALALLAPGLLNSEVLEPWPVLASYLFIPFERPDGLVQPLYSLGWTLNYEMFFYGLFALFIALPERRAILALAASLLGLILAGRLLALPEPFAFWTAPILLEFAFGLALGMLRGQGVALGATVRILLAAGALGLLALDLTQAEAWVTLSRPLAWGLPAALLVAAAALGREAPVGGWATRLGAALGDASYALYLLHPFAIRGTRFLLSVSGLDPAVGPGAFMVLALLAAVLASLVAHRLFERPATEWLRRSLSVPEGRRRDAPMRDLAP